MDRPGLALERLGPDGSKASDFEDRRDAARYAAEAALKRFEKEPAATSPGPEVDRSADAARDKGHPHDLRTMLGTGRRET
ncbi:hypothetical protein GS881_24385 [Rhodococcus hoagii]|nr:hypothetical protein [Prescottella equi]